MKKLFLSLGLIIIMAAGGYLIFNVAKVAGEVAGYSKGMVAGQDVGYATGKEDGYDVGHTAGQEMGYSAGKKDGYDEGFAAGKKDGEQKGYETGYTSGAQASLGHGYTLRDPTYAEVIAFLAQDKTSDNKYNDPVYVCTHFARDVGNAAEAKGIRCAFVDIRHPGMGHAIVAFNTIDRGMVFFEPQFDAVVNPVLEKKFYQCIEPKEGYYFDPPPYDDTINDILVIW